MSQGPADEIHDATGVYLHSVRAMERMIPVWMSISSSESEREMVVMMVMMMRMMKRRMVCTHIETYQSDGSYESGSCR
jgi:hypothetical protein